MKLAPLVPRAHLFVCANRRDPSSPLGPGCGDAGAEVLDALRRRVGAAGLVRDVWITETRCLGLCPGVGTTVASYARAPVATTPLPPTLFTEVVATDAGIVLERAVSSLASKP